MIDAGRVAQRLDELSTARVIGKIAEQIHQAQQRAGASKAVGPITPAGIAIDTAGAVKLGLAEPTAFAYCAPEQAAGGEGDRRSDVFSLGVIMWEALTHRPLFDGGSDAATRAAVAEREVTSPSTFNANVPAELGAICMKALARNPADRYQSAKVMAAEIEAVLEHAGYVDNDDKIAAHMARLGSSVGATAATHAGFAATRPPSPSAVPALPAIPRVSPRPSAPAATTAVPAPVPSTAPAHPTTLESSSASGTAPGFAAAPNASSVTATANSPAGLPPTLLGSPPSPVPMVAASPVPQPAIPPTSGRPSHPAPHAVPSTAADPLPSTTPPNAATSAPQVPAPRIPDSVPEASLARTPNRAAPHPAAAVSLPSPNTREPELLEKWSWQTGAQPVYQPDDEIDDSPRPRSPVPYIVGAGLVFAGAILTIMVAFGGAKKPAKKSGAAAAGSSADPHSVNAPHDAAPADLANPGIAPPPTTPDRSDAATASAPVDATAADAATADAAAPPLDSKPQPTQEKPVPSELPAKRSEKSEAKIEAKPDAKIEAKPNAKVDPKPTAKPTARSAKADAAAKSGAEQAYRQGLQLFMRGDTSGAARALRTSLGASPNYAPAWRALGLVFEKTGDTDQARTAFKRYLQLAPSANDAQQIRNRLEKLGS